MTKTNTLTKIGAASLIMMASVFASRVIGVFREMTIAGIGGVSAGVDAYQVAFIIPEILNHIVASGFLSITFIPIFSRYLARNDEAGGYRIFSIIHNTFGLLLLLFILVTVIWTPSLVGLFAPGIEDPATFALAVKMTRIIIPAQFFFFSGGLLMAVQFAHEKFLIPALAPLIYNISIILGGLFLGPFIGMEGFAWGVLIGAFAGNFLIQALWAKRIGLKFYPIILFSHPDLITYIKMTLPLMLGLTMTFSTEILLKFFGSYLPVGSIAALNYALRVMFILVGLFGQAVGVASYPFMAKLAEENRMDELNRILNRTLKFIFLVIPVSVLLMVASHEIILLLFQRASFGPTATRLTAGILPYFMVGAFAFSAQTIVSRGYYATRNTLFPTIFTTLCVIASLPLIYGLMKTMGPRGVALGLSISVILQSVVLFECWNKKSRNIQKREVYLFLIKLLPLTLVMGLVLWISHMGLTQLFDPLTRIGALAVLTLTGTIFLFLFWISGRFFKIEEITILFRSISERLLSWKKKLN